MPVQILLQGKLSGTAGFLISPSHDPMERADGEALLGGRAHWVSLLSEVLPRAVIAELGLSSMLLGSSGAGQFLIILPGDARARAGELLDAARAGIRSRSGGWLDLAWAVTENLGDWTVVRRRLNEEMSARQSTPLAESGAGAFDPTEAGDRDFDSYFACELGRKLREASSVGWSPETPEAILLEPGKYAWNIGSGQEAIPLARQAALTGDGNEVASTAELARRAEGRPVWGVLRGDTDDFGVRLRRAQSIEEHVQLCVLYKHFFAGELEVLCSMPEFWSKVTLFYSGGDDFAVYGAWDSLISLAREVERLFSRFAQENLKDFPGPEGKTISMALALAADEDASLASVYRTAGERLGAAKSADKDCFSLLGRTLEWKQLSDAAETKDDLTRLVREFGVSPDYIRDLCSIYRETRLARNVRRPERPWRFHRRLNRILPGARAREFQKARAALVANLAGRNPSHLKLRPSGRVALEWARLLVDTQ